LDEAYQSFLERHRKREAAQAAKRARLGIPSDLREDDDLDEDAEDEALFQEVSDKEVRLLCCSTLFLDQATLSLQLYCAVVDYSCVWLNLVLVHSVIFQAPQFVAIGGGCLEIKVEGFHGQVELAFGKGFPKVSLFTKV
jgi:hypothetical protein